MAGCFLVLSYFTASSLQQRTQEHNETFEILEWARTGIAVSGLIHQLQKERGLSLGLLASGGENFSEALSGQHQFTNRALDKLSSQLGGYDHGWKPRVSAIGREQLIPLDIKALRQAVLQQELSKEVVFERYNALIDSLVGQLLSTMSAGNGDSTYRLQLSFIYFLQVKDIAGQERALVTAMLSSRDFNPVRMIEYHRIKATERSRIERLEQLADPILLRSYHDLSNLSYNRQGEHIRRLIVAVGASDRSAAVLLPTPEHWFELASRRIDDLGRLEELFNSRLMEAVSALEADARLKLIINIVAATMSFSLAGLLIIYLWHGRNAAEERLELASAVFGSSADAILITDPDLRILEVNGAFSSITLFPPDEVLGRTPALWRSGHQGTSYYKDMWRTLADVGNWKGEVWNRRRNGELYPALLSIASVKDFSGRVRHFIGMIVDLSQRKQAEALLEQLRTFDPVTNLPNRDVWRAAVDRAIADARGTASPVAVITIGLDRFKRINDSLGHLIGDRILLQIAARMKEYTSHQDILARLDGDCFGLLRRGSGNTNSATAWCHDIQSAFASPFQIDDQLIDVTAGIGIACYPADSSDTDELLRCSEAAMHRAKEDGPGSHAFYSTSMDTRGQQVLLLERMLRQGLDREEFSLVFQPQLSAVDGRLVGVEALLRWFNPQLGNISPVHFIPIAEESGLIFPIGAWTIQAACKRAQSLRLELNVDVPIAVNLSARQFRSNDLKALVRSALDESGLPSHLLELEITEGLLMNDPENTILILDGLRQMGVRVALDDFGTGYSSLAYLKKFPIDRLKIDRAFVRDLPDNEKDQAIARTVLSLGRHLKLEVLAEGVETQAQADFLKSEGCDLFQGYLYGKPMSPEQLVELIRNGHYKT